MKPTYEELVEGLREILMDFETEGCDDCGTISTEAWNSAEALVARAEERQAKPLTVEIEDLDDGSESI